MLDELSWREVVAFAVLAGIQLLVVVLVIRCCRSPRREAVAVTESTEKADPTSILPGVFAWPHELGLHDASALRQLGITHVVHVAADEGDTPTRNRLDVEVYVLRIAARDVNVFPLHRHFREVSQFISSAVEAGGGAVVSGSSGSFAPVAALLMAHMLIAEGMSLAQSFVQLDRLVPQYTINLGFWSQLEGLERAMDAASDPTLPLEAAALFVLRRAAGDWFDPAVGEPFIRGQLARSPLPEWWEIEALSRRAFGLN